MQNECSGSQVVQTDSKV